MNQSQKALDWVANKFAAITNVVGETWNTVSSWFGDDEDEKDKPKAVKLKQQKIELPTFKPVALTAAMAAVPTASMASPVAATAPQKQISHTTHNTITSPSINLRARTQTL
ncbi:MAG: hypothetical protein GKR94_27915 [Gammaproteobacteria bacterium]|nr:hypothetical protein [Gammaproteobacteria bacterium]